MDLRHVTTDRRQLNAARTTGPLPPAVTYLLEHNRRSRGQAERSGLTLRWRGPDAGNPDTRAVRLVHADRDLPADRWSGSTHP